MTRDPGTAVAPLAAALAAGALLAGCGSQTRTVSATSAAPLTASGATTGAQSTRPATTSTATISPAPSAATAPAATTPRTAPEPAFTEPGSQSEGAAAAAALLRAHGYTPKDISQYHAAQTLRAMVGTRTGSGDGYGQQAFFFIGGRYIGTDSKEPSASVKIVSQGDTEVTLAYPLYRNGDPLSSPSGGQATVRFQLNNGKLVPLGPIPPAHAGSGLSRY